MSNWRPSNIDEEVLAAFMEKGWLPSKEVALWILRGLLDEWGLELQHLNLTEALHVAGFVSVCEDFFRMDPCLDFLRWTFTG